MQKLIVENDYGELRYAIRIFQDPPKCPHVPDILVGTSKCVDACINCLKVEDDSDLNGSKSWIYVYCSKINK